MPITESNKIVWEFACQCGNEETVPASETDFTPTGLRGVQCPECDERMRHVGPVLDTCDSCGADLLYNGCSGLGTDTLCERCYERASEML